MYYTLLRWLSDGWQEPDKLQHLLISLVLIQLLCVLFGMVASLLICILIGLLKEVWDHVYGSGFCWRDMLFNLVGAGLGLTLILL